MGNYTISVRYNRQMRPFWNGRSAVNSQTYVASGREPNNCHGDARNLARKMQNYHVIAIPLNSNGIYVTPILVKCRNCLGLKMHIAWLWRMGQSHLRVILTYHWHRIPAKAPVTKMLTSLRCFSKQNKKKEERRKKERRKKEERRSVLRNRYSTYYS